MESHFRSLRLNKCSNLALIPPLSQHTSQKWLLPGAGPASYLSQVFPITCAHSQAQVSH